MSTVNIFKLFGTISIKDDASKEIDKVDKKMKGMTEEVKKQENAFASFGKGLGKVGANLTKYVSLPLIGVGTAVGKMAISFESSFAKVSTLLDSNVVDFDTYKKSLIKASSESKVAVDDFSESVYSSISAGVDQTKAIEFTTGAMKLARGGFTTGAKAVDVMTTAINGYKLTTEGATKISDLLINTQNLGKTTVDELASSMGKVIPIASNSNFNITELSASYALLTKNGIATAESGTYLKSMLNELTKSGSATDLTLKKLTKKGFAQLKLEGKSTTEILGLLDKEAKKNNKSLKDMFGSVEAGTAALMIATGGGGEYNEMLKSMEESAGATQMAVDKIDASPAEKMKDSLNKLKNAGIQLGTALIPTFEKVAEKIGILADKVSGLSSEQVDSIVNWGLVLIAIGPVLKGISTGIGLFTTIKGAIVGGTTALGLFGGVGLAGAATSIGGFLLAAAPFVAVLGGVAWGVNEIYKGVTEDGVPAVDLFADTVVNAGDKINGAEVELAEGVQNATLTISEATKESVGSYMAMDRDVSESLFNMKNKHLIVTGEMATELTGKFDAMGQMISTKSNEKYEVMLNDTKAFFAENNSLTDEEEAEVLAKMDTNQRLEQGKIKSSQDEITRILNLARDENRSNTETEVKQMEMLKMNMKDDAVRVLSETEQESNIIRERLKEHQGRINAEMASEIMTKAFETRDKSIQASKDQYEGVVKNANTLLKAKTINQEQYDKMVKDAQGARDESIKSAEQMAKGVMEEIVAGTPGIELQVNTQTGKIMSAYDKVKLGISGIFSWLTGKNKQAAKEASNISYGGGSNNKATVMQNWTGTRDFKGGLTTLHEKGNEIYDLPSGSRVYNAEMSEEMAQESAFQVAKRVLDGATMPQFEPPKIIRSEPATQSQPLIVNIENFVNESKQSIEDLATELNFYMKQKTLGKGVTI